jgi:hypothetical protein
VHVVAARLGHADPAVTLRAYSHVLREHAAGIGDIFAQAVQRRALASPLARQGARDDQDSVSAGQLGGQGQDRTADLPLFRCKEHRIRAATRVVFRAQSIAVDSAGSRCTEVNETRDETIPAPARGALGSTDEPIPGRRGFR